LILGCGSSLPFESNRRGNILNAPGCSTPIRRIPNYQRGFVVTSSSPHLQAGISREHVDQVLDPIDHVRAIGDVRTSQVHELQRLALRVVPYSRRMCGGIRLITLTFDISHLA
jgi:hypothetical protein